LFDTKFANPIVGVGGGPSTSFIPNATDDSCANPTAGGWNLNTEYTFFKKVSPTIHLRGDEAGNSTAKNAPMHIELLPCNAPALKSAGEICHCGPPNDMVTVTSELHGIIQKSLICPVPCCEPGTC